MNTKYLATIIIVIIIAASALGYLAYNGTLSPSSNASPTPTPTPTFTPTATSTPTPTAKPSSTPTTAPTTTATQSPTPSPSPTPTYPPTTLTVFAASSLTNVIGNMTAAFESNITSKSQLTPAHQAFLNSKSLQAHHATFSCQRTLNGPTP